MNCISFMHTFLFKSDCGDLESVRLIAKFILIKSNPYRVFNFNFILTYWTLSRSAAPCSLSTPDFAVTFDRNKPQNIFFLKIKFGEYSQYYIRIVNPQYWKKKIENRKSLLKLNMIIEIYVCIYNFARHYFLHVPYIQICDIITALFVKNECRFLNIN